MGRNDLIQLKDMILWKNVGSYSKFDFDSLYQTVPASHLI